MSLLPSYLGGSAPLTTAQVAMSTVRNIVRERADMVGSLFCTDAELLQYINLAYFELYDLLVQKYGDNYFVTSGTITTNGTSDQFALATDFYKLLGVELYVGGGGTGYDSLLPFNFADRNKWSGPIFPTLNGRNWLRYRLNGSYLWLAPRAAANQTVRYWYVPRLTPLVQDTDVLDGVSGWEAYVIVDAVIKAKTKEESDVSVEMAEKQALIQRIEAAAENRDAGMPATVTDVRGEDLDFGRDEWGY